MIETEGHPMFLGIDLGTSSVKVMAVSEAGVRKARAGYPPGTGAFEHDAGMVADTVREALLALFAQGVRAEEIQAIGLCGHGPSVVFLDENCRAVTPIVTWQDKRAYREAEQLQAAIPGFTKDGTSYEAKLCWFYRHRPDLFQQGAIALYPKDYLLHLLCPGPVMDSSTASTLAFYDASRRSWDGCDPFFPKEIMPRVAESWVCAGETSTAYAASCGLVPGTPVYPGGIDSFCEAVGAGGFSPDTAVDGSGTSTCLTRTVAGGMALTGSLIPPERLPEHVLPDAKFLIHMLSGTGLSYEWFSSLFTPEATAALQAQVVPERPVPLLYLPYLSGERFPVFDDRASGVFLGLRPDTDRAELLQGLFQGAAFAIAQNFALMGEGIRKVRAVGGANRSAPWLQIKANATNLPYEQMAEPDASALGAALIAALGSGAYDSRQLERLVQVTRVFEPQAGSLAAYEALKTLYGSLYGSVRESLHGLFGLREPS